MTERNGPSAAVATDQEEYLSGAILTLLLIDERSDAEYVADLIPDATVRTFDEVLTADDLDIATWAETRDALAIVPRKPARALLNRSRDALLKVGEFANSIRLVEDEIWNAGDPFREPPAVTTPRGALIWLRGLPSLPSPKPKRRRAADRNQSCADGARYNLTDSGNARRFATRFRDVLHYCHPWGKWIAWDGTRWAIDQVGEALRLASEIPRDLYREAAECDDADRRKAIVQWGRASEGRNRRRATVELASVEEGIPVLPDAFDRDPWAFNCPNGTIDLRNGELRPHRREDLITKLCPTPFDPTAPCPLWDAVLGRVFGGNDRLIAFVQRLAGYGLTGIVAEHVLPILWGSGANGKSTIINALLDTIGSDYAMKAPPELLMARRGEAHPTGRADLCGKRLVVTIETDEGARLNEPLIKELTGGDPIRARRMREDHWEFRPTHKLLLATNHKPVVRGTDHGIWRRLQLIPFAVTIPRAEQDAALVTKLAGEAPGILAWCVRGCLAWRETGLRPPDEITAATEDYRQEQDTLGAFLAEECVQVPGARTKAGALYERYRAWAERSGEAPVSAKRFGLALTERGVQKSSCRDANYYEGIGLRSDAEEEPDRFF